MTISMEGVLGFCLRRLRARDKYLAYFYPGAMEAPENLRIMSTFMDGGRIPKRYAGIKEGMNLSPMFQFYGIPPEAKELLLVMQDPDSPLPKGVVYFIVSFPAQIKEIEVGELSVDNNVEITFGLASFNKTGYQGPQPMKGHGEHRYVFQVFALDTFLNLEEHKNLESVMKAITTNILAKGKLIGTYSRN